MEEMLIPIDTRFNDHMAKYGLSYDTQDEYRMRRRLFAGKDDEIRIINSEQESFKVGHNKFSTWSPSEM